MLRSNLAELLSQRRLKITRVANDTGLSRTTITALAHNDFKGVQADTINLLCQYLGVDASGLFDVLPFDLDPVVEFPQPVLKSNHYEYINSIELDPFDCDLFLKRTSINNSIGKTERTFDLIVRFSQKIVLPIVVENDFVSEDLSVTELRPEIFLGNATDSEVYNDEKEPFFDTWQSLNAGFQADVRQSVFREVHRKFFGAIHAINELGHFDLDFDRIILDEPLFPFENAFRDQQANTDMIVSVKGENLPF